MHFESSQIIYKYADELAKIIASKCVPRHQIDEIIKVLQYQGIDAARYDIRTRVTKHKLPREFMELFDRICCEVRSPSDIAYMLKLADELADYLYVAPIVECWSDLVPKFSSLGLSCNDIDYINVNREDRKVIIKLGLKEEKQINVEYLEKLLSHILSERLKLSRRIEIKVEIVE